MTRSASRASNIIILKSKLFIIIFKIGIEVYFLIKKVYEKKIIIKYKLKILYFIACRKKIKFLGSIKFNAVNS